MTPPPAPRATLLQSVAREVWREVRRTFLEAGVPCLPVKGIVTGRWLYDQPGERELSDVDVRIRAADRDKARRAGLAAGWTLLAESRVYQQLLFAVGGLDVDVECSVGPPGFTGLEVDALLARAAVSTLPALAELGSIPEAHDHALLLVANAAKDHFVGASPWALEDLRRIVRQPELSPGTLVARARQSGMLGMMALTAGVLGDEPAWQAIGRAVPPESVVADLYITTYQQLLRTRTDGWPLRVMARLAPDGYLRPATSLMRAAAWELEHRLTRREMP